MVQKHIQQNCPSSKLNTVKLMDMLILPKMSIYMHMCVSLHNFRDSYNCVYMYLYMCLCRRGGARKHRNDLLEGGPMEDRLPSLGECSRNPSGSGHQLELL